LNIDSLIRKSLLDILPEDLYASDFNESYSSVFVDVLKKHYSNEEIISFQGKITSHLEKFFEKTNQEIRVSYNGIDIKVTKVFSYKNQNGVFDKLIFELNIRIKDIVRKNKMKQLLPHLIMLSEDVRKSLFDLIKPVNNNDKFDYIRNELFPHFSLESRDIVLFLRNRIYIRKFQDVKNILPQNRRYDGFNVEKLDKLYKEHFPNGAWDAILEYLPDMLSDQLNFSRIDNETFRKHFSKTAQATIEIMLVEDYKIDKTYINGFSGYILRQYFNDILVYTAKNLLSQVESRYKHAEQFIKYYSNDITLEINGHRVKHNPIIDANSQQWNFSSILSMLIQYQQAKVRVKDQKDVIESTKNFLEQTKTSLRSKKSAKEEEEKKLREVNKTIHKYSVQLDKLKRSKKSTTSINSDIIRLTNLLGQEETKREALQISLSALTIKYENMVTDVLNREKILEKDKEHLKKINLKNQAIYDKYDLVVNALVKVLLAKNMRIDKGV